MIAIFRHPIGIAVALLTLSLQYGVAAAAQAGGSPSGNSIDDAGTRPTNEHAHVREAGPLDGQLCCKGIEPLVFNGSEALAVTGRAGIFKSFDHGSSWARSMAGLVAADGVSPFVNSICQAPSDPRIVYALAGDGVAVTSFNGFFSSNDFGRTWVRRGSADTGFGLNECRVDSLDPRKLYLYGFDSSSFANAIWRSTDGGETLQPFGVDLPNCSLGIPFPRRGILYLMAPPCSLFSTDDGNSFQPLPVPADFQPFDVSPDGNSILVGTSAGTLRSIDRGMTFTSVSGLPNGFDVENLAFDPTNAARIYATDGHLQISVDAGASFTPIPATFDVPIQGRIEDISVDFRGSLFVSTPEGIFRSDDAGKKFHSLHEGFRASSLNDLGFDAEGKLLVPVYHTNSIYRQTHGTHFKAIGNPLSGINGSAVAGSPVDSYLILLGTDFEGVFRTDDGGSTWTSAIFSDGAVQFPFARMFFATPSRVYLVALTGFYRSDDAGQSFTQLTDLSLGALAVDPRNPDVVYVGTYNSGEGLYKSTDAGQTFLSLNQPGAFTALVIDRRDPKIVYAGQRSGQVIRSLDGGKTFSLMSTGLRGAGVLGIAQDAQGTLFAWIRGGGLFSSDNLAVDWRAVDTDQALQRSGVEFGRGVLVADPRQPGHVYLGNAGVLEIVAGKDADQEVTP